MPPPSPRGQLGTQPCCSCCSTGAPLEQTCRERVDEPVGAQGATSATQPLHADQGVTPSPSRVTVQAANSASVVALPALQTCRTRWREPVSSQTLSNPPHGLQGPHALTTWPDVLMTQPPCCVTVVAFPPAHSLRDRLCVPLSAQTPPPLVHCVQAVQALIALPVVDTVQAVDSLTVLLAPPLHTVLDRVFFPIPSQPAPVAAQTPHGPHAVTCLPSVATVHAPVSALLALPHVAPLHAYVVQVRLRLPVVSHVDVNPPQALHAPHFATLGLRS